MRNFVTGVVLGGVVAAGGLVVASQIAPIKVKPKAELAAAEPSDPALPQNPTPPVEAPDPVVLPSDAQPEVADPAPVAKAPAETDEPLLKPLTKADAPPPASVVPDLTVPSAPGGLPEIEAAPPGSAENAAPPEPAVPEPVLPEPVVPEAAPEAQPDAEAAEVEAPDAAAPLPEAADPAPEATEDTAPVPDPAIAEDKTAAPKLTPRTIVPDPQRTENTVEGVTTGRLPAIEAPAQDGAVPDPAEDAPSLVPEAAPSDLPPLRRYAQAFENPEAKPLFAVLLVDNGAPEVPREALAALPFPVTFVLDPLADGAAEAAAIYRKAGQEVVMLATGIPAGATPGDLEQSFAGMTATLQESVALVDTAEATFQNDGKLSGEVVTLLADQGWGLITYDHGLNAADQVARREGLPTATIYRSLDDEGEEAPLIRRYLDRAAFKAAQEGQVAVIGTTRADTITALMEWTVEGRAASVALAPISALMQGE